MSGSEEGKAHELVIIRRRGHDEEGGHHGGVWKIAYADFMTAMMAFFLVMWLINSTDKKTLTQVATYFNPMRLTDKKPSTKGLEEPSGGEGKDAVKKAPAKKDEAKAKSKKNADETPPGEVRSRGQAFQSGVEDQDQKQSGESGATSGDSRQAGGRAYRDPFDAINRSEITPNEPTNGRISRTPLASAPPVLGREASAETKPAAPKQSPTAATPPAAFAREASVETKPAAPKQPLAAATPLTPPAREAPVEVKPADPRHALASPPQAVEPARDAPAAARSAPPTEGSVEAAQREAAIKQKEAADRADAAQLEAAIKQAVAEAVPGSLPNIEVVVTPEGVLISLTDDYEFGMFAIASADPRPAMIVVMDKIAKLLQTRTEPLVIRGHTDRRPYRTATYDNWRLSAARAHMAYVMLARSGVDEKRFERIEGHADRSLRVQQDPEAAQNRRIEILLRK
jgi:chemotaxis protein MotB